MNSSWENTLDFRSPTGSPLADTTPSRGERRFDGWEEKNSFPRPRGATLGHKGVERGVGGGGKSDADVPSSRAGLGRERTCSYMSRSFSKSVGKKISK